MAYIQRSLEKVVEQVTKEYPVVLVTGPRQVGKTTMLKKLMEGSSRGYVSLDDLNDRALAKNDPELFLQLHKPPVLIDEVQYAPELFTGGLLADRLAGVQVDARSTGISCRACCRAVHDLAFAVGAERSGNRAVPG